MTDFSTPVDMFNPGQVFACLGFLEAAELLLGNATGGFDWSDDVRFLLRADGDNNPFAAVLEFLANVEIQRYAPVGYSNEKDDDAADLIRTEAFPQSEADRMTLPVRLHVPGSREISLSHWADGSTRKPFKLYAGKRSADHIVRAMLRGTFDKPKNGQDNGAIKTKGVATLWKEAPDNLVARPFDVLTIMGGSFNFDPRGAWTALDAGYSPNDQKHGVAASPVVELLAALGLEHARPVEFDRRQLRYSVWSGLLPPALARPALGGAPLGVTTRTFRFELDLSGKNKVATFAEEEP